MIPVREHIRQAKLFGDKNGVLEVFIVNRSAGREVAIPGALLAVLELQAHFGCSILRIPGNVEIQSGGLAVPGHRYWLDSALDQVLRPPPERFTDVGQPRNGAPEGSQNCEKRVGRRLPPLSRNIRIRGLDAILLRQPVQRSEFPG